ncbi:FAD-binding protein, partial [Streptomyces lunaelactis]|nr:FAD-binding protein [Streptomyces lunaelactis]
MTRKSGEVYDVVVVGGGTAGLSAALILGRSRRSVLVVDAGEPRNAPAAHMHGYLSRDGMSPAEFLAVGRREVAAYGVELWDDRVTGAERDGAGDGAGGFSGKLAGGRGLRARPLVVTPRLGGQSPWVPGGA